MNEYSLMPVQEVDGLHIKRDDLYAPFGPGEVFLSTPSARRATSSSPGT